MKDLNTWIIKRAHLHSMRGGIPQLVINKQPDDKYIVAQGVDKLIGRDYKTYEEAKKAGDAFVAKHNLEDIYSKPWAIMYEQYHTKDRTYVVTHDRCDTIVWCFCLEFDGPIYIPPIKSTEDKGWYCGRVLVEIHKDVPLKAKRYDCELGLYWLQIIEG